MTDVDAALEELDRLGEACHRTEFTVLTGGGGRLSIAVLYSRHAIQNYQYHLEATAEDGRTVTGNSASSIREALDSFGAHRWRELGLRRTEDGELQPLDD